MDFLGAFQLVAVNSTVKGGVMWYHDRLTPLAGSSVKASMCGEFLTVDVMYNVVE
jgi:hypothetical protein